MRLSFHGRLTELDEKHSLSVGKETIPGVRVLDVSTSTEMKSGQTLIIGGMPQLRKEASAQAASNESSNSQAGAKAADGEENRDKTMVLILVQPELVHPLDETDPPAVGVWHEGVHAQEAPHPIAQAAETFQSPAAAPARPIAVEIRR